MTKYELAVPLAHDSNDERRGSWTGEFAHDRRTSFSNSFLETPPGFSEMSRTSVGSLHFVPLDNDIDPMSTPPISPVAGRRTRPSSSYFESPTRVGTISQVMARSQDADDSSSFSNLLNKAFETVSKSGEAMDLHGKNIEDLAQNRRSAKGKSRAVNTLQETEPLAQSRSADDNIRSRVVDRDTYSHQDRNKTETRSKAAGDMDDKDADDFYALRHFETGLANALDSAEKQVASFWSWLTD